MTRVRLRIHRDDLWHGWTMGTLVVVLIALAGFVTVAVSVAVALLVAWLVFVALVSLAPDYASPVETTLADAPAWTYGPVLFEHCVCCNNLKPSSELSELGFCLSGCEPRRLA